MKRRGPVRVVVAAAWLAGGCSNLVGIGDLHPAGGDGAVIDAAPGAIDGDGCPAAACADYVTVRTCAGGVTHDTTCSGAMPICEAGACVPLRDVTFTATATAFNGPDMVGNGGLAVADVDGDHLPDVLARSKDGMYFHNLGNRSFAASVPFSPGTWQVVGDFNHDGYVDLVVGDTTDSSKQDTYLGDGKGGFALKQTGLPGSFSGTTSLAVADIDGDGNLDFAYVQGDTALRIVYGKGDGSFEDPVYVTTAAAAAHLAIGDVTGDHQLDLLVRENAGAIEVFVRKTGRTFGLGVYSASPTAADVFLAADTDGDGYDDVITTSADLKSTVVLPSVGDGTFAAAVPTAATGVIRSVAKADLNGDRLPDLVEVVPFDSVDQTFVALLGRGAHAFKTEGSGYNDTGIRPIILAADLDGDQRDEILYSVSSNYTAYQLGNTTPHP